MNYERILDRLYDMEDDLSTTKFMHRRLKHRKVKRLIRLINENQNNKTASYDTFLPIKQKNSIIAIKRKLTGNNSCFFYFPPF